MKDCQWFLKGFCCKDLDAGRCWDCTAPNKLMRVLEQFRIKNKWWASCKYPKLGKDAFRQEMLKRLGGER